MINLQNKEGTDLILFETRGIAKHPSSHNKKAHACNKHEHSLITVVMILLKIGDFPESQVKANASLKKISTAFYLFHSLFD